MPPGPRSRVLSLPGDSLSPFICTLLSTFIYTLLALATFALLLYHLIFVYGSTCMLIQVAFDNSLWRPSLSILDMAKDYRQYPAHVKHALVRVYYSILQYCTVQYSTVQYSVV